MIVTLCASHAHIQSHVLLSVAVLVLIQQCYAQDEGLCAYNCSCQGPFCVAGLPCPCSLPAGYDLTQTDLAGASSSGYCAAFCCVSCCKWLSTACPFRPLPKRSCPAQRPCLPESSCCIEFMLYCVVCNNILLHPCHILKWLQQQPAAYQAHFKAGSPMVDSGV